LDILLFEFHAENEFDNQEEIIRIENQTIALEHLLPNKVFL
jgi:hypothetical protein